VPCTCTFLQYQATCNTQPQTHSHIINSGDEQDRSWSYKPHFAFVMATLAFQFHAYCYSE
jgi:hypothetical protein